MTWFIFRIIDPMHAFCLLCISSVRGGVLRCKLLLYEKVEIMDNQEEQGSL